MGSDGNAVSNWDLVDSPLTDVDYVGSATVGELDTYDMAGVSTHIATLDALGDSAVRAVQQVAYALASDAGAKNFKHVMRSGAGTLLKSSNVALTSTVALYKDAIRTTDADAAAWTREHLDAHEFGFEVG
jgi:hypothetical protein